MGIFKVTIGMPVKNCEATIAEAIVSVINQTIDCWKLIIVDDGSIDNTAEIVSNFNDDRIIFLQRKETKGLPARLNEIIKIADTEFFARMDGDDISYPERLENQLSYLINNPSIDLIGAGMLVIDSEGKIIGKRTPPEEHNLICKRPWLGIPIPHPTFMARTEWLKKHMYNPYFNKTQDLELLMRTYETSKFGNIPSILIAYRQENKFLKKILISRWSSIKILLLWGCKKSKIHLALMGILLHLVKLIYDALIHSLGIEDVKLKYKAKPSNTDDENKWRNVKARLFEKMEKLVIKT